MDRKMFETGLLAKKEEMKDEAHSEALDTDKKRDELLADMASKKAELAEIEGKPESSSEKKELFKIWRTVELGTGLKTAKDFEKALKKDNREISDYAKDMLKEVEKEISESASYEKREIDLVEATPAELGFPKGGTLEQIYEAAKKHGLEKCPREAGPQSAIQYEDQPKGEYRLIGMDPVIDSGGGRRVFRVDRIDDGKRWLTPSYDRPGRVWFPGARFVFVRRKKLELKP